MKRLGLFLILLLLLLPGSAEARQRLFGWCETGNKTITVATYQSSPSTLVQGSYPQCNVTVYVSGSLQVLSGTYVSGGTITGTVGQTITLFINGGTGAVATATLTATNSITSGSALIINSPGGGFTSTATSATCGNGTAICTGTVQISTTMTGNLATIYQDNANTPLTNPFTANTQGLWYFYADPGRYDVQLSGGSPNTLTPTFTEGDQVTFDEEDLRLDVRNTQFAGGAKCNGLTDDTAALQAADTVAIATGKPVYIPAGVCIVTPPLHGNALPISDGFHLIADPGGTIKVANGVQPYNAIFYAATSCNNCSLQGLTIDSNIANNPIANSAEMASYFRIEIEMLGGANILIANVHIQNSSSVNSIDINGVVGTVSNVVIRDCTAVNMGDDPNHITHDMSVIYVEGQGMQILGNTITAAEVNAPAGVTGIETHGGAQMVANNLVNNFIVGMNITGINKTETTDSVVVANNVMGGGIIGIYLWSEPEPPQNSGYGLTNTLVTGNVVRINQTLYPSGTLYFGNTLCDGILFQGGSSLNWQTIRIENNLVVFDLENTSRATTVYTAGIGLNFTGTANALLQHVDINDNTIENVPIAAILVYEGVFTNFRIERNTIIDAGSTLAGGTPAGYAYPILFGPYSVKAATISDNHIIDDLSPTRLTYGLYMVCYGGAGQCNQVDAFNNDVKLLGTPTTSYLGDWVASGNNMVPHVVASVNNWNPASTTGYVTGLSQVIDPANSITWTYNATGHVWLTSSAYTSRVENGIATATSFPFTTLINTSLVEASCATGAGSSVFLRPTAYFEPAGAIVTVKDLTGVCNITSGNSALIDGQTTYTLYWPNQSATFQFDGTNWFSIANAGLTNFPVSSIRTATSNYSAQFPDSTIVCDSTGSNVTIHTFTAPLTGQIMTVKKLVAANTCFIAGSGGQLVDGAAAQSMSTARGTLMIQFDGSNWQVIAGFSGTNP